MRKQLTVLLVGIAAVTAVAAGMVHTARGTGVAANRAGRAEFRFEAQRGENGDNVRIGGSFQFATMATDRNPERITIHAREVKFARFDRTQAVFGGPAVRTIRNRAGSHETRGMVEVFVNDRKAADANRGEADVIQVRFRATERDAWGSWEGLVQQGDIAVTHREVR